MLKTSGLANKKLGVDPQPFPLGVFLDIKRARWNTPASGMSMHLVKVEIWSERGCAHPDNS